MTTRVCPHCGETLDGSAEEPTTNAQSEQWSTGKCIGVGLFVAGTIVSGGALAVTAVGFGASGIVGGSIAAGIQSSIGNVAAGSNFANMQSAAATGTVARMGLAGGAVAATGAGVVFADAAGKKKRDDDAANETKPDRKRCEHCGGVLPEE